MATGLVNVLDASVSCQAEPVWPSVRLYANSLAASFLAGRSRQAAQDDRSIPTDKRAVIPILQVCSATRCVCSCRRGQELQGKGPDEPNLNLSWAISVTLPQVPYPVLSLCSSPSLLILQRRGQPANLIERHRYLQLRRTEVAS